MPPIDYSLSVPFPAPTGYPSQAIHDRFTPEPIAPDFATRRALYIEHVRRNPAPEYKKAPYLELVRLAAGDAPHLGILAAALDFVDARRDCADFVIHAVLRWLYQFGDHPALPVELTARARRTVLDFKYWPDEPGSDSMCTWTENHQILFAAAAHLAGQLYPDDTFTNSGRSGREQMARHRPRLQRWLDLRFRTGFSEWLSEVYYDEDQTALLSLVDFCADDEIATRAAMVLDLTLLDMALNSHRGVLGCTHGRSYAWSKRDARQAAASDVLKLLFGCGVFGLVECMAAPCFALSPRYRMPEVLFGIANDRTRAGMTNRQRMGIRIDEAERWGLRLDNVEDGMVLLSLEAYTHPRSIALFVRMLDELGWWKNDFFSPFRRGRPVLRSLQRLGLLPAVARLLRRDITRNLREQVDVITYRTPDYLLSSAVDYRKGYGGDQQHIWQASLGGNAVCFTTHPAKRHDPSPSYWTGSGNLPRVAQIENVLIAIYNISALPGVYVTHRLHFTHAWLPRHAFDEVVERDGWIFARHAEGYLALRPQHAYRWQDSGDDAGAEILVDGKQVVWLCELGRAAVDGPFEEFVERIRRAAIEWSTLGVVYDSPSQGRLEFTWNAPLRRNGFAVDLHPAVRYDNPYVQAAFPAERIRVEHAGLTLDLDWVNATRDTTERRAG
jgi:hypothetical protein